MSAYFTGCCGSLEGLLQISPVERGVVTLLGVRSDRFVAMNHRGKLYGSVSSQETATARMEHTHQHAHTQTLNVNTEMLIHWSLSLSEPKPTLNSMFSSRSCVFSDTT